jgi:adenosylcobinamide-GDP ribazoletransferase
MAGTGNVAPQTPPRPLVDFAAAIGFLTLLPIGRSWPDDRPPRSVGWYPWVGWILGAAAAAPFVAHILFGRPPFAPSRALMFAAGTVAFFALVTRFLHWDGLADTFDGIWGGRTREARLEIMRDSRIGSFGAAAMLVIALVQVTALSDVLAQQRVWVLLAAPIIGRFAASAAAWMLPPARREGLGLTAMERPRPYDVLVASSALVALLGVVTLVDPVRGGMVLAAGLVSTLTVPRLLARPVEGMTGDLFGATVLIVETVVLLSGAVV